MCGFFLFFYCFFFFNFPAIQKAIQSRCPVYSTHIPDLIGRENRSLASQCIKTKKIQCTPIVKKKKKRKKKKKNNNNNTTQTKKLTTKRNNSIISSLLGLQWAVNLLPWETCGLPEAETNSALWTCVGNLSRLPFTTSAVGRSVDKGEDQ